MAYCAYTDVNLLTNIASADVANADVTSIIAEATKELNSMMNVRIIREKVSYIDQTRENKTDGSNVTYYIKNWEGKFLADMNNDGSVSTSDVEVIIRDQDGVETSATVSSVDAALGKFVLSTAPASGSAIFVTYEWAYRNPATPDPLIKLACVLLSAAYCYGKINVGRAPQVSFGNMRFYRHMNSFDMYYRRFLQTVSLINNRRASFKNASSF